MNELFVSPVLADRLLSGVVWSASRKKYRASRALLVQAVREPCGKCSACFAELREALNEGNEDRGLGV